MTQSHTKDVRTQMLQALAKYNIKQVDVARQAGIHHSTLSLWLQGKVKGHYIKIEDTLTEWLENLYSGRPRYTTLNKTVDKQFILTPHIVNIKKKRTTDLDEVLIPIHFDLQLQGKRYKEQFCWNINQPYFTPEQYARQLVLQNPMLTHFETQIIDTIRKAINSYRAYKPSNQVCLKVLQIDIKTDNICLKDRFQWDINDESNSPQDFAFQLSKQLNLNQQFMVKIAHQIRQQIQFYRKTQIQQQHHTYGIRDDSTQFEIKKSTRNLINLSGNLQKNIQLASVTQTNYIRVDLQEEWQPRIQILDAGEIRKFQKLEQRQNRYARRTR